MKREAWGSTLGFILSTAGSAVGLANIWRFPFLVGNNGGAAFIILYLLALLLMGFPVFISELLIGRTTQATPGKAFFQLGKTRAWKEGGRFTILTGFFVSGFYSVVAGWILGYLIEASVGNLSQFTDSSHPKIHYEVLLQTSWWNISFHFLFLFISCGVLLFGVKKGIERANRIMMPALFALLIFLAINGLSLSHSAEAMEFLFTPRFDQLTAESFILALGQAFFTLSIGQGTIVTYGSYLSKKDDLLGSAIPIVLMDTFVSIMASIAIFTTVFSVGLEPNAGSGLLFHTLPWVFSQISGGYYIAVAFFLIVTFAALTSEISALEPPIAYLVEEKGWTRRNAVFCTGIGAFCLGIPAALSTSLLKHISIADMNILELMDYTANTLLIPIGGFLAIMLVGWRWGAASALKELFSHCFVSKKWEERIGSYFWVCFKYLSPVLMLIVFIQALRS